ncbi:hypothetical protein TrLO_g12938 [Triparma laevis f. longispina]|uniref:Multidrug and toxic compound extrusion protein n=1 Tax=Triparma laevis f. longispina TaxID=1714387 RepID=A0A9W7FQI5_9STRA|nr:hypothetical protein TrLO_g12938 [Triparma laevis f. longispina]
MTSLPPPRFCPSLLSTFSISLPVTLNMIFYRLPWLASLHFVGNLDLLEGLGSPLAAAALASTIANVTGLSIVIGLSSSLSTLSSQSFGHLQNSSSSQLPQFLTTGLTVHYLFTIPIALMWLTELPYKALIALGQPEVLSRNTGEYLKLLSPGLLGHTLMFTLMPFCQSIGLSKIPAISATLAAIIHVPLNLLLIPSYGYLGAASATSITQWIGPLIVYLIIFVIRKSHTRAITKSQDLTLCFNGTNPKLIFQYLRLGLPGLITISEWWASEVAIFLAGHLSPSPETGISAMTIYQSLNSSCFMFAVGFSVAASSRVGKFLGMHEPVSAKYASRIATFGACLASGTLGFFMYTTDHTILPRLFTNSEEVVQATAATLPLLSLYVFADGVQVTLSGVLKGCGMQMWMMPVVVFSYWFIGLPFSYYVTFVLNKGEACGHGMCGVVGLTSGMCLGTWVHFLLMIYLVECKVDWKEMSERAIDNVGIGSDEIPMTASAVDEEEDDEEQGVEMMSPEPTQKNDVDSFFSGLTIKKTPKGYGKLESEDSSEEFELRNTNHDSEEEEIDYDKLTFGIDDDNKDKSLDRLRDV